MRRRVRPRCAQSPGAARRRPASMAPTGADRGLEAPTLTRYAPCSTTNACAETSQTAKFSRAMRSSTHRLSPAASSTRAKPASVRTARCTAEPHFCTYTCATSAPARASLIAQREAHAHRAVRKRLAHKALIGKARVAQSVPERKAHVPARLVVVAIADVDALVVGSRARAHGPAVRARHVARGQRPSLGQLAAGVCAAPQQLHKRRAALLAAKARIQHRPGAAGPRHLDGRAAAQHDDDLFAPLCQQAQKARWFCGRRICGRS